MIDKVECEEPIEKQCSYFIGSWIVDENRSSRERGGGGELKHNGIRKCVYKCISTNN